MRNRFIMILSLLLLVSGTAWAQDPDTEAPAAQWPFTETACDGQIGVALGLCLSYCEAMECDLANDYNADTKPRARGKACNLVRSAYERLVGDDLPCECPCWDDPNLPIWSSYLAGEVQPNACFVDASVCVLAGAPPSFCTPPQGDAHLVLFGADSIQFTSIGVNPGVFPPSCGQGGPGGGPDHVVSLPQGVACKTQLNNLLAASGITCQ